MALLSLPPPPAPGPGNAPGGRCRGPALPAQFLCLPACPATAAVHPAPSTAGGGGGGDCAGVLCAGEGGGGFMVLFTLSVVCDGDVSHCVCMNGLVTWCVCVMLCSVVP